MGQCLLQVLRALADIFKKSKNLKDEIFTFEKKEPEFFISLARKKLNNQSLIKTVIN